MAERIIPVTDPNAEVGDQPVVLINLETGRINEVPCGPKDAAHLSGDRIVLWSRTQNRPEIPRRHAHKWAFYKDFCSNPKLAKKHKLTRAESAAYYEAYLRFMKSRGTGAKAKHMPDIKGEDLAKLWHPEVMEIRKAHKNARGQTRGGREGFDEIVAGLGGGGQKG